MKEIWKDIDGYEGYYQVSNLGRIRSLNRISKRVCRGVQSDMHIKERMIKQRKGNYYNVGLCKENIRRVFSVHRLVAEAFIPNPENKNQVNHKDGDKFNNKLSNLEWVTGSENNFHALKMGLSKRRKPEDSPSAKINHAIAKEIRELYKTGNYRLIDLEKIFPIKSSTISGIINNKVWKESV